MIILEILIIVGAVSSSIIIAETFRREFYKKMERMGLQLAENLSEKFELENEDIEDIAKCREFLSISRKKLSPLRNANRIHTINNYKDGLFLKPTTKKYSKKLKLCKNILFDDKYNPNIFAIDVVEPDWVRKILFPDKTYFYDNRTYIQCFDESTTEKFKDYFDKFYLAKKLSPFVGELQFQKSNLKPLRVSCPDRRIYEKGVMLLVDLAKERNAFPITVKEYGNYLGDCLITKIKNIGELNQFSNELSSNLMEIEASRTPFYIQKLSQSEPKLSQSESKLSQVKEELKSENNQESEQSEYEMLANFLENFKESELSQVKEELTPENNKVKNECQEPEQSEYEMLANFLNNFKELEKDKQKI